MVTERLTLVPLVQAVMEAMRATAPPHAPLAFHDGHEDSPHVVLVNGLGTNSDRPVLRQLARLLRKNGITYRTFSYNADPDAGFCGSDTVRSAAIGPYVEQLDALIARVASRRVVLVGHSLGGLVCAEWLLQAAAEKIDAVIAAGFIATPWSAADLRSWDADWGPLLNYQDDPRQGEARRHIERLIGSLQGKGAIAWSPTTRVWICDRATDGLIHPAAYGGRWLSSNATVATWSPPLSSPLPINPHTHIARAVAGDVAEWILQLQPLRPPGLPPLP